MTQLVQKKLEEIEYADINPKDHDLGVIYQSIKRFGFINPPLVNTATGKLLAGHGRLETLKMIKQEGQFVPKFIEIDDNGEWLVPVLESADLKDEGEAQAYLLADNRITEIGGWHTLDLVDSLKDVIEATGSLDGIGYEIGDIEDLLEDLEREEFSVRDYGDGSAGEDETSATIQIGRYKQKVPIEDFYDWEQSVKGQVGTSEINEINEWIKSQLGL